MYNELFNQITDKVNYKKKSVEQAIDEEIQKRNAEKALILKS